MKKTMAIGMTGLVGVTAIAAGVSAFGGQGKGLIKDNVDLQTALDNNDYDSFIETLSEIDADAAERITEEKFEQMAERYEIKSEVEEAIENDDYDAWVTAVSQLPHGADIAEIVTEDEWDELKELHEAKQNGDRETAKALAEEIGLPEKKHGKGGHGKGLPEDVREALENEDYDAFVEALEDDEKGSKLLEYVDEDNFDLFVDLHNAIQDRDKETAEEIREELGLPEKPQRGDGERRGPQGNGDGQRFGSGDSGDRSGTGPTGFGPRGF